MCWPLAKYARFAALNHRTRSCGTDQSPERKRRVVRHSACAWGSGSHRMFAHGCLAVCCLVAGVLAGCARPQGVLFAPLDPATVWPPPPDTPRVRLLGSISDSRDLKAARSGMENLRGVLRGQRPPISFSSPHSVAINSADVLAVADGTGGAVHVFDLTDRSHRRITGWENAGEEERFAVPLGVVWAKERIYVTDAKRHEVIVLDAMGNFHTRFGAEHLIRPVGLTFVEQRDQLYVVDGGAHAVKVFDVEGRVVSTIGRQGVAPGEFNFPSHICSVGASLVVADSGNARVQWLDLDGRSLMTVGRKGDGAGDFSLPKGVAVDSEGHLYVVDAQFENVQVFNAKGQVLMAFGSEGRGLGEFWLPAGLAIDQQDRIWVADSGNRRVQVFEYMRAAL